MALFKKAATFFVKQTCPQNGMFSGLCRASLNDPYRTLGSLGQCESDSYGISCGLRKASLGGPYRTFGMWEATLMNLYGISCGLCSAYLNDPCCTLVPSGRCKAILQDPFMEYRFISVEQV